MARDPLSVFATITVDKVWSEETSYEAGRDDSTLEIQGGRTLLHFSQVADDLSEAISSAIRDVRSDDHAATLEES